MVSLWILTLTHIFTQNSLNITSHSHAWYSQNTLRFNILPHTVRQDAYIYYFPLYLYATYSHLPHLTLDNHAKCPLVHYFTSHIIKKNAPYLLIYLTHSNKTQYFLVYLTHMHKTLRYALLCLTHIQIVITLINLPHTYLQNTLLYK